MLEEKSYFPNKGEEGRGELETLIKNAGKWELVSDLNVYSLTKFMSDWSPELIEKIKEFQKKEEACRIYLSNLKEGE